MSLLPVRAGLMRARRCGVCSSKNHRKTIEKPFDNRRGSLILTPVREVSMRPRLQFLSTGSAVRELQALLNQRLPELQPALMTDGKFGEMTLQRVRAFQKKHGLTIDGVVGPVTWAVLAGKVPPKPAFPKPKPAIPQPAGGKAAQKAVVSGCTIRCTHGSQPSTLKISGARPACIGDCQPFVNVPPFGLCRTMANPHTRALTLGAQATAQQSGSGGANVLLPGPCVPVLPSGWSPAGQWELVNNFPSIDRSSVLMCGYGGMITIA